MDPNQLYKVNGHPFIMWMSILLFLIASIGQVKAQDWTYKRCFKRCGGYKHVYRLQGLHYPDTSEMRSELSSVRGVEFKFYAGNHIPLVLVKLTIKDLNTGRIVQETYSDFDGLACLSLDKGRYELNCWAHNMISFKDTISVPEDQGLFLTIRMARDTPLSIYMLGARKRMSPKELEEVKQCLWSNFYSDKPCDQPDRYVLWFEI